MPVKTAKDQKRINSLSLQTPHPILLPIGWGEGARRADEGVQNPLRKILPPNSFLALKCFCGLPMKIIQLLLLAFTSAALLSGCKHYDHYLVSPAQHAQLIGKTPVHVAEPPLDYTLSRYRNRLYMDLGNTNDTALTLLEDKSYVVDPYGRTHPIHGGAIAPHSFIPLALPTPPMVYQVQSDYPYPYWGGYYGWGPPFRHHYYHGGLYFYGPPPPQTYSVEVPTPYTWSWPKGQVNLRLTYDQGGGKLVEHNFIFEKRETKK
jgi:hypothetical protein